MVDLDVPFKRLPVVADGKVIGMLTRADFVRALAEFVRQPHEEAVASDAEIKTRIEAELNSQPWAPLASLNITVKQGVVEVCGVVTDQLQRFWVGARDELDRCINGNRIGEIRKRTA